MIEKEARMVNPSDENEIKYHGMTYFSFPRTEVGSGCLHDLYHIAFGNPTIIPILH